MARTGTVILISRIQSFANQAQTLGDLMQTVNSRDAAIILSTLLPCSWY